MIFARSVYTPIVAVSQIYKEDAENATQRDRLTLVEMYGLLSRAVDIRPDHGG
jgi:hypothetical protein